MSANKEAAGFQPQQSFTPQVLAKFFTYDIKDFPVCNSKVVKKQDWNPFSQKILCHTTKSGKITMKVLEVKPGPKKSRKLAKKKAGD